MKKLWLLVVMMAFALLVACGSGDGGGDDVIIGYSGFSRKHRRRKWRN